jgi:cytoskeletal protein CcmA (bactofilin family)
MKTVFALSLAALLSSCSYFNKAPRVVEKIVLVDEGPTSFRASRGEAVYDREAYSYLNTAEGPLNLNHTTVTHRVLTDESLTALSSDIGGVCVGENAWICDSSIRGSAHIQKELQIYQSEVLGDLFVGKELVASEVHFAEDVTVEGNVTAQNSTFEGTLTATADIVCLSHTQAKSIRIKDCGPYWDKQIVRLRQESVVEGDIIFESGRGRLLMDDCSRFKGTLSGGQFLEQCKEYGPAR